MPPRKRARAPVISAAPTTIALQRGDHTSFLEGLAELWRAGTLCDVTVLVGGRSFKAHRLVLAASSPYFAAMNGGWAEASTDEITLQELSAPAFEAVLSFLYTRRCELAEDLLQPLLEAAHRLQLADLLTAAVEAVVARLDSSNCLDAWNVGEHLGIADLSAGAKKVALKSFSPDLAALPAFAALPASLLEELLASDELDIKQEKITLEALEQWVAAQAHPPAHEVTARLISHIRFAHIDGSTEVEASPLVQRHPMILAGAYREALKKEDTPRTRPRKRMRALTTEDLKEGMMVRVKNDLEAVRSACNANSQVGWDSDMKDCVGGEYRIVRVFDGGNKVRVDTGVTTWLFTFDCLELPY